MPLQSLRFQAGPGCLGRGLLPGSHRPDPGCSSLQNSQLLCLLCFPGPRHCPLRPVTAASCFQVTEEAYVPVSDMNGLGFKPFDLVIPFAVRKGEITGKHFPESRLGLTGSTSSPQGALEVLPPAP